MSFSSRGRVAPPGPQKLGSYEGLAYALYLPAGEPRGGVVILHGAGSCKERHLDFARAARGHGFAAIAYDQRGHGASEGELDARLLDDLAAIAALLPPGPLALRGSSMGGYMALVGAARVRADAIVAICPAPAAGLARALQAGALSFAADQAELNNFLTTHDELEAATHLRAPLLLMHAEGDEQVPVERSRALLDAAGPPVKRLIAVPGGHHRSVQHDAELQAVSLRFIDRAFQRAEPIS
jgi:alpha-beta hydrolase superfamily lysophospholipase